jgi:hypothetical protein
MSPHGADDVLQIVSQSLDAHDRGGGRPCRRSVGRRANSSAMGFPRTCRHRALVHVDATTWWRGSEEELFALPRGERRGTFALTTDLRFGKIFHMQAVLSKERVRIRLLSGGNTAA